MPSVLTPHVWYAPALTEVKVPAGGVAWFPWVLSPQHAMVPSVFIPQACIAPALTETKVPSDGVVDRPREPQEMVPSVLRPQVFRYPLALTETKVPAGGVAPP